MDHYRERNRDINVICRWCREKIILNECRKVKVVHISLHFKKNIL